MKTTFVKAYVRVLEQLAQFERLSEAHLRDFAKVTVKQLQTMAAEKMLTYDQANGSYRINTDEIWHHYNDGDGELDSGPDPFESYFDLHWECQVSKVRLIDDLYLVTNREWEFPRIMHFIAGTGLPEFWDIEVTDDEPDANDFDIEPVYEYFHRLWRNGHRT